MTTATQSSSSLTRTCISGAWVEGAKIAEDINPSDTNDVVGLYTHGGRLGEHSGGGREGRVPDVVALKYSIAA